MENNNFLECVPFHVGDNSQNRADKRPRRGLLSALYLKKLTYLQDPRCKIDFTIFGLKRVSDNSESISKKIDFSIFFKETSVKIIKNVEKETLRKNHFFQGHGCFWTVFDRWPLSAWLKIRNLFLTWPNFANANLCSLSITLYYIQNSDQICHISLIWTVFWVNIHSCVSLICHHYENEPDPSIYISGNWGSTSHIFVKIRKNRIFSSSDI